MSENNQKKQKNNGEKKPFKVVVEEFKTSLKSNPQTLDEAKAKTKSMCILAGIVFGVFVIIFGLLSIILGLIWAVVAAGIIAFLYYSWTGKNKRNFCPDCGARYDYEKCVGWRVSDVEEKRMNTNPNSSARQVIWKQVATVHFTCTCEQCGHETEFSNKYDIKLQYDDGTVKENNLQKMAADFFKL